MNRIKADETDQSDEFRAALSEAANGHRVYPFHPPLSVSSVFQG
jgi:hypothetical protein